MLPALGVTPSFLWASVGEEPMSGCVGTSVLEPDEVMADGTGLWIFDQPRG